MFTLIGIIVFFFIRLSLCYIEYCMVKLIQLPTKIISSRKLSFYVLLFYKYLFLISFVNIFIRCFVY